MGYGLSATLYVSAFIPSIIIIFLNSAILGNSITYLGLNLISSTTIFGIIAIIAGIGVLAAFNFLGSGLNSAGTAIVFTLTSSGIMYGALISLTYGIINFPLENYLDLITTILFVTGATLIAYTGGRES